jgi:uncharacterized oxidoreductase
LPLFAADELLRVANRLLRAIGATEAEARIVADHLVDANLAGHDSHGVVRIPQYHSHAVDGKLALNQTVDIERDAAATAVVNGNWTWGPVVAIRAAELAIAKARRCGLAAVGVRQCYHVGRVGAYAQRVAERGLIAKIWCNAHGVARVAPWGGIDPRFGTNPVAVGLPTSDRPIVVDITTSVVAEGKIRLAHNQGKRIPDTWVLDANGNPTTNPGDLYAGGSLLPFGGPVGHKGYGLSIAVDVFGGILTRDGCGTMPGARPGNGLLFEVLDPQCFLPGEEYFDRIEQFIRYIRSARTRPGVAEILLPGEPEYRTAAERRATGIPVDDETWRQVRSVAESLGIDIEPAKAVES